MTTQLPPRPETETPGPAAPTAAEPASPTDSTLIPEWVRYFPTFPRLEGIIDEHGTVEGIVSIRDLLRPLLVRRLEG